MQNRILLPFLILGMVMILVAGCTDSGGSANTPASTPAAPTASAADNTTPDLTPAATAAAGAVTTVPTLSPVCSDLLMASGADQAFLDFVNGYRIVDKVNSLANDSCTKSQADLLNQQVMTSAIPRTNGLAQARKYLVSATTYCQYPDSAAPENTLADLAKFEEARDEYLDLLYACHIEISINASAVAGGEKLDLRNLEGPQMFSGTGNSVGKFIATQGTYKFTVTYSGSGNYTVQITNVYGKTIAEPFHITGPYTGSALVTIPANGEYYMTIGASAPYLMKMVQA
jgi:hypothetical protein